MSYPPHDAYQDEVRSKQSTYDRKSGGTLAPGSTGQDLNKRNNGQSPLPSISLPKGGGAIRGIGEKFAANPVTGTGSMTVPIYTSSGRSGFGPQISLSYDSGAGNGPFGFGWDLSLSSVTRKTEKGLPKYQDNVESDTFSLSGAEDLVPVLVHEDGEWQPKVTYYPDPINPNYVIHYYKPRIEGLFARIECWTNLQSGETHWRSISRDNITTIYGKTRESRIADPTDPLHIFSWLICESFDDKGNAILYEYKEENSEGIDLSLLQERNRSDETRSTNRYLKRIKYGNKTPRQLGENLSTRDDWMFEVVFDYGEHYSEDDQGQPTSVFIKDNQRKWLIRQDPFSRYRPGFEVRTYRLCQRVLMFHHFPAELGVKDCLVRSTDFKYDKSPIASFITGITHSGYVLRNNDNGTYLKKPLPPLEFGYSKATINESIQEIDSEGLKNLPYGLDGSDYQWIDLDGEGLQGILTEQGGGWFYKRNLSSLPLTETRTDGRPVSAIVARFAPVEQVATLPSLGANLNQLIDLAGDGQLDLVRFQGPISGYYERTQDGRWETFVPFTFQPNIRFNDPNLRFVDLTGDGHADILITQDQILSWYPSLAETGFGQNEEVPQAFDEEKGPKLVFADGTESIYLADMSGDGLSDLVRISNGEVYYWPNLGYGRFGSKVTMDNAPWFDSTDQFNQRRIRLADIDGSGVTDIIYLNSDGVYLYFNQSGNSWADAYVLKNFPQIGNLSSVMVTDLLCNGTACLVWSSPLPEDSSRSMRYIDLMGKGKPHLLVSVKNNLGAETKISYAPSTKFYLADKIVGKSWVTRLPFPVHVVELVEIYDLISRNHIVNRYIYHHGYFDGYEREFRGFGYVEQLDTEEFATLIAWDNNTLPLPVNVEEASYVPPVLTKTWYHTGISLDKGNFVSRQFEDQYYKEPGLTDTERLPDTIIPAECSAEEQQEACRALKGVMLRQEVFALDNTPKADIPYTVTEQNFTIRRLQPRSDSRHAVFFTHPRETITYHYERNPVDPRISHVLTLEVDDFGNELKQASIGYGRRRPDPDLMLQIADREKQTQRLIAYIENRVTNAIDITDDYLTPLLCETRTYELTGYVPTGSAERFQATDFVQPEPANPKFFNHIYDNEIAYEDHPSSGRQRRLIEHGRTLYRPDDLGSVEDNPLALLPLGTVESHALSGQGYRLVFTPGLLAQVYQVGGRPLLSNDSSNPNSLTNVLGGEGPDRGGYVLSQLLKANGNFPDTDPDDHWWVPTGRTFLSPSGNDTAAKELEYARKHFFMPLRYRNPFHTDAASTESFVILDSYDLLMQESRDPVDNLVTARNDYRVLQPQLVTDPNHNRIELAFDALSMMAGTAVKGKDENEGDTLGTTPMGPFEADLTEVQINEFYQAANPHVLAPDLLKGASTRIIYDLESFRRTRQAHPDDPTQWIPVYAAILARETHVSDSLSSGGLRIQINFTYSDGFGREIQKKIQAEPELSGSPTPRWVGSGWTLFNNKGKPVRKYEPFFSQLPERGHRFESAVEIGVSSISFYDPVERVVATLHPNHTYEKIVIDPWRQASYDVNDTVAAYNRETGDPRTDLDILGYTARYFATLDDPTWQTWFEERQATGTKPLEEQVAATKSAVHADTPTTAYFDTLGRSFLTVVENRFDRDGSIVDENYTTRVKLDIEGNQREVRDAMIENGNAQGRVVMLYDYDMLGNRIHQLSMEAGERWMLNDAVGKPIRTWDSRGHTIRLEYDALRRQRRSFVKGADPADLSRELLTERMIYGEQVLNPENELRNLRGKLYLHLDQVGALRNEEHDFTGNLLRVSRSFAMDYQQAVDWLAVDDDSLEVLEANLPSILEKETFTSRTTYDALNRVTQIIAPHSRLPGTKINIIQPVYNEANLWERLHIWLDHGSEPEGMLDPDVVPPSPVGVNNIDYNAKGQRQRIDYKNGVSTLYDYDRQTFRLNHLLTLRDVVAFPRDCPEHQPVNWPGCQMQNLHYTYDPVGNITKIRDDAQETIFFRHKRVEPNSEYTYDAVYRLIESTGREHLGQIPGGGAIQPPSPTGPADETRVNLAHPGNGNLMGNYSEHYEYDSVGNILEIIHRGTDPSHPGWILPYNYNEPSLTQPVFTNNRLSSIGERRTEVAIYNYDAHGNMISMPHLSFMQIDYRDQLSATTRQIVNNGGTPETTYYTYDTSGRRVRKVTERYAAPGEIPRRKDERFYLGGFEIHREYNGEGSMITLERETLDIMDDTGRIALVETRTRGDDRTPEELIRYQFNNHLGSATLELDNNGHIISFEEYYPFGSTSYQAVRNDIEVAIKRYRYSGKERDEESGLYYYGARYYSPWLRRWLSADPVGLIEGVNAYEFVRGNPVRMVDLTGLQGKNVAEDLFLFFRNTAGFFEGKEHPQVIDVAIARANAFRFGMAAQKMIEPIITEAREAHIPGAERVYSEVAINRGTREVLKIGDSPIPGADNLDLVAAPEGSAPLTKGSTAGPGAIELVGDVKHTKRGAIKGAHAEYGSRGGVTVGTRVRPHRINYKPPPPATSIPSNPSAPGAASLTASEGSNLYLDKTLKSEGLIGKAGALANKALLVGAAFLGGVQIGGGITNITEGNTGLGVVDIVEGSTGVGLGIGTTAGVKSGALIVKGGIVGGAAGAGAGLLGVGGLALGFEEIRRELRGEKTAALESTESWSDLWVEGEKQGGFKGFAKKAGGWTFGFFSALIAEGQQIGSGF